MTALRRYAEIYGIMLRNSLIREMSFKANFLLWMLVELLWFLGQIIFIQVIFGFTESVGGWTKWEMVLLIGTHQIIAQIFQAFFYMNVANIPDLVRTGKMDFLLMLPVDAQFAASAKQFGLDNLVNALVGVAFVLTAIWKLGVSVSVAQVALYLACIACGVAVHYGVMLGLSACSFWIVRADGLIHGYYNLFNIGRYPDVIYRGVFKFVFSWVLPIILVANVPARVLARFAESPGPAILQLFAVTAGLLAVTRFVWQAALRRYGSASS
ncbi:MAG: ABC-2 family transporter protein [Terrimicrobiaceae bacterium]|nr:ABC-2 family transporter protein [Terrimicrobiaceae bacterium]